MNAHGRGVARSPTLRPAVTGADSRAAPPAPAGPDTPLSARRSSRKHVRPGGVTRRGGRQLRPIHAASSRTSRGSVGVGKVRAAAEEPCRGPGSSGSSRSAAAGPRSASRRRDARAWSPRSSRSWRRLAAVSPRRGEGGSPPCASAARPRGSGEQLGMARPSRRAHGSCPSRTSGSGIDPHRVRAARRRNALFEGFAPSWSLGAATVAPERRPRRHRRSRAG